LKLSGIVPSISHVSQVALRLPGSSYAELKGSIPSTGIVNLVNVWSAL
jgi:hypothetical protein